MVVQIAYGYIRVSTPRQGEDGYSLEAQEKKVLEYHQKHLEALGVRWGGIFYDEQSASKVPFAKRKQGQNLMLRVKEGDWVIVGVFDRAFRSVPDYVDTKRQFDERKVILKILTVADTDASTPEGEFILHMLAAVAQLESRMNSRRTKEALAILKARGVKLGMPFPKVGEKWVGKKGKRRKVADAHDRAIMRKILEWKRSGLSYDEIYFHLIEHKITTSKGKAWSRTRITRAVANEILFQKQESQCDAQQTCGTAPTADTHA